MTPADQYDDAEQAFIASRDRAQVAAALAAAPRITDLPEEQIAGLRALFAPLPTQGTMRVPGSDSRDPADLTHGESHPATLSVRGA